METLPDFRIILGLENATGADTGRQVVGYQNLVLEIKDLEWLLEAFTKGVFWLGYPILTNFLEERHFKRRYREPFLSGMGRVFVPRLLAPPDAFPGYEDVLEFERHPLRRSAAVSRKLRLLVAHELIQKVLKTHRYPITSKGRQAVNALLTVQQTSMATLANAAA